MQVQISLATGEAIAEIALIAAETWPSTYGHFLPEGQIPFMLEKMYNPQILTQQMKEGTHFYLANLQEKTIGFAAVSVIDDKAKKAKLHKLYVLPNIQKNGAGKALLQASIDYAKKTGCTTIELQVNNQNIAKQFYEKQGFYVKEAAVFDIGNGFVMDDYVMVREL